MDNTKDDGVITGPPPVFVCSLCGPRYLAVAGRIIHTICSRCQKLIDDGKMRWGA